jgi:hypothetical protein
MSDNIGLQRAPKDRQRSPEGEMLGDERVNLLPSLVDVALNLSAIHHWISAIGFSIACEAIAIASEKNTARFLAATGADRWNHGDRR